MEDWEGKGEGCSNYIVKYRKAPHAATGLLLFSEPIALFSGRSSYSGRTGSCNEMTETNAGRMLMCCLPCRDTSGGHSELGLKGKQVDRFPPTPQDSVSALSTGPGLSRGYSNVTL